MAEFSAWLRQQIRQRGLTNRALARRMGVDAGSVSRVLNGERQAGPDFCTALADALGLDAAHVFRRAGLLPPLVTEPVAADDPCLAELLELASQLSVADRRRLVAVADLFLRGDFAERPVAPPADADGGGTTR
jgi:transcriptional regulator with XRE-family HTH domain